MLRLHHFFWPSFLFYLFALFSFLSSHILLGILFTFMLTPRRTSTCFIRALQIGECLLAITRLLLKNTQRISKYSYISLIFLLNIFAHSAELGCLWFYFSSRSPGAAMWNMELPFICSCSLKNRDYEFIQIRCNRWDLRAFRTNFFIVISTYEHSHLLFRQFAPRQHIQMSLIFLYVRLQ